MQERPTHLPLPTPSQDAKTHCARFTHKIIENIHNHNGWISFADYMQTVLYQPGWGYYTAGAFKFGAGGDFVTAPMISPLFSQCLAHFCMAHMPFANLLELGAGTGVMAKDILLFLEQNQHLPEHYYILEVSADLRERQQHYLQQHIPHLFSRIQWLDTLPQNFVGIILANEVLDAMPVHLFHYQNHILHEVGVSVSHEKLIYKNKIAEGELKQAVSNLPIADEVKSDYLSEINLQLPGFLNSLSDAMKQGLIVFIDYGFDEQTYYMPSRWQGTLMCHYRHHAHTDPFLYPGLQDITAHVDFTGLAHAGKNAGLEIAYHAPQARFLLDNGLIEFAQTPDFITAQQVNTLTAPHEMGELFKVMAFNRQIHHV